MKKLLATTFLLFMAMPIMAKDWTPMLGDLLTKNSQNIFLKNQKTSVNFLDTLFDATVANSENATLTANAKKGIYPTIPRAYQQDVGIATLRKVSKCTTLVTVPLKNATLFGQPIKHIGYNLNSPQCNMDVRSDFITFGPMPTTTYQRLKQQLTFTPLYSPQDAGCVGDINYPKAKFSKKGNQVVLDIEHLDEDC